MVVRQGLKVDAHKDLVAPFSRTVWNVNLFICYYVKYVVYDLLIKRLLCPLNPTFCLVWFSYIEARGGVVVKQYRKSKYILYPNHEVYNLFNVIVKSRKIERVNIPKGRLT